jgi:hypothetical protein
MRVASLQQYQPPLKPTLIRRHGPARPGHLAGTVRE